MKGIDILCEAIKEVLLRYSDECEFHCYGEGEYYSELMKIKEEYNLDNLIIYGNRDKPYMQYYNMDVYISTSRMETFPMGIVEALSTGLPVLTTNVGAINEIVEDGVNGYLVEVEKESVCEGIRKILVEKTALMKMGKQSRNKFIEHFSTDKWVSEFTEVFIQSSN